MWNLLKTCIACHVVTIHQNRSYILGPKFNFYFYFFPDHNTLKFLKLKWNPTKKKLSPLDCIYFETLQCPSHLDLLLNRVRILFLLSVLFVPSDKLRLTWDITCSDTICMILCVKSNTFKIYVFVAWLTDLYCFWSILVYFFLSFTDSIISYSDNFFIILLSDFKNSVHLNFTLCRMIDLFVLFFFCFIHSAIRSFIYPITSNSYHIFSYQITPLCSLFLHTTCFCNIKYILNLLRNITNIHTFIFSFIHSFEISFFYCSLHTHNMLHSTKTPVKESISTHLFALFIITVFLWTVSCFWQFSFFFLLLSLP